MNQQPIGIFDSGIGGLTLAHAVRTELPYEDILYFGDTAHMPYGEKSAEAIFGYAKKITQWLLGRGCKIILVGCNSAASSALDVVRMEAHGRAIVVDVIHPVVEHIEECYPKSQVALLGTQRTVDAGTYQKLLQQQDITCHAYAAPLLAAAIENHWHNHAIIDDLLQEYLSALVSRQPKAVLLACTHYPIIQNKVERLLPSDIKIIDSVQVVLSRVKESLAAANAFKNHTQGTQHFYVSDYTDAFARAASLFFGEKIQLEHLPLWA